MCKNKSCFLIYYKSIRNRLGQTSERVCDQEHNILVWTNLIIYRVCVFCVQVFAEWLISAALINNWHILLIFLSLMFCLCEITKAIFVLCIYVILMLIQNLDSCTRSYCIGVCYCCRSLEFVTACKERKENNKTTAIFILFLMCLIPSHVVYFSCDFCIFQFPNIFFQWIETATKNDCSHSIVFFSFYLVLFSLSHCDRMAACVCSIFIANQRKIFFHGERHFSYNDNSTQFVADGLTFTYSIQPGTDGTRIDNNNPSNHRIVITSNRNLIDKKTNHTTNKQSTTASTSRTILNEQSNSTRPQNNIDKDKCKINSNNNDSNNNNNNQTNKIGNNTTSKTSQTSTTINSHSMSSVNEVPIHMHIHT